MSRFARAFFKYSPFLSCTEEAVLALGQKVSDELKQLEPVEGKGMSHSYIYRISIYYKHFFIDFSLFYKVMILKSGVLTFKVNEKQLER